MGLRAVLTWAAITRVERGVELAVRNSKTIQFFERIHTIPLVALFYPVHALDLLVEMCGVQNCSSRTPVFKIPSKSGRFIPWKKPNSLVLDLRSNARVSYSAILAERGMRTSARDEIGASRDNGCDAKELLDQITPEDCGEVHELNQLSPAAGRVD